MKSIGIITIHKSLISYGASLQAYALWAYIESMGYNCEIIDLYRPVIKGYIDKTNSLSFKTYQRGRSKISLSYCVRSKILYLQQLLKYGTSRLKSKRFKSFNMLVKYSQSYKSIDDLYQNPPVYDYYISGSDQIWNTDMPFENEPYLLSFVNEGEKCISYASSFGRVNLPNTYKFHYSKLLHRYKAISVREISGSLIIEQLLGTKPIVTLDPTMLFEGSYWQSFAIKPNLKKKYLFCFSLNNNEELIHYSSKICKSKNMILVSLSKKFLNIDDIEYVDASDSGPKEWLGLIASAELVITDSFHGTLFSILFQKHFYSYVKKNNKETYLGTRIENILYQLSLNYCLLNNLDSTVDISSMIIDYSLVNNKLDALRLLSKIYLNEALS